VLRLSRLPGLPESIVAMKDEWRLWVGHAEPHTAALPLVSKEAGVGSWEKHLTPMQKMLLLKIFRRDKLTFAFSHYVSKTLGNRCDTRPLRRCRLACYGEGRGGATGVRSQRQRRVITPAPP
jgi:hypothetical protein